MPKKICGAVFLLVGVLVLMGAGCSPQNLNSNNTNVGTGKEIQKPEQPIVKPTGKITDEQCLDVLAHQLWAVRLIEAKKDVTASAEAVKQANALQQQYGISDDDLETVCNAKIGEVDFLDKVEKRMQVLGFVIK